MQYRGDRTRSVCRWARYADMPTDYVELDPSAPVSQKRARGEAQDAYRKEVADRPVIDTVFDAMRFFQELDPRLVANEPPAVLRWAFAETVDAEALVEVPDSDPQVQAPTMHLT
jgi:hypothetical protein